MAKQAAVSGADERGEKLARIGSSVRGRMSVNRFLWNTNIGASLYTNTSIIALRNTTSIRHWRLALHNTGIIALHNTASYKDLHGRGQERYKKKTDQQAPKKAPKQQLYLRFRENSLLILPT